MEARLDDILDRLQARDFYDAIQAIEKLGASDDLTAAVNAVGGLMRKYGNHIRTREETEQAIAEAVEGLKPQIKNTLEEVDSKNAHLDKINQLSAHHYSRGYIDAVNEFDKAIKEWQ